MALRTDRGDLSIYSGYALISRKAGSYASRRQINQAVRAEFQQRGLLCRNDQSVSVFVPRLEVTGTDRAWASQYEVRDVLRHRRGSDKHSLAAGTYSEVIKVQQEQHQITVRRTDGLEVSYAPSRLKGVDTYKPVTIQLTVGNRVQFTAPMKDLRIANREQGTVEELSQEGRASIHLDSGRKVSLDPDQMRHLDHGYAVTSHSAQGLTADRVLLRVDTGIHPELVSDRFAYVSISRTSQDATVFTNSVEHLAELSRPHGKSSALETTQKIGAKPDLINLWHPGSVWLSKHLAAPPNCWLYLSICCVFANKRIMVYSFVTRKLTKGYRAKDQSVRPTRPLYPQAI